MQRGYRQQQEAMTEETTRVCKRESVAGMRRCACEGNSG